MKPATDFITGIIKQYHDLTIAPQTVVIYLFLVSKNDKEITTKDIVEATGINVKTVRKHLKLLEAHDAITFGPAKGTEHRQKVMVVPLSSQTIPSNKLSIIYSILNIASQKTNAHIVMINNSISNKDNKEDDSRVWSGSEGYVEGLGGLKAAARRAVTIAVARGELIRPSTCSACDAKCHPSAHHHKGYEEESWLDVLWLCNRCHAQVEMKGRRLSNNFSLWDIQHDADWAIAKKELEKYFKGFEIDPNVLVRKRRFESLISLLSEEGFDFAGYCAWYAGHKYASAGFNFGLFLYPNVIAEYRDRKKIEGKYLKTSSRLKESDGFKADVDRTKDFLNRLEDE